MNTLLLLESLSLHGVLAKVECIQVGSTTKEIPQLDVKHPFKMTESANALIHFRRIQSINVL